MISIACLLFVLAEAKVTLHNHAATKAFEMSFRTQPPMDAIDKLDLLSDHAFVLHGNVDGKNTCFVTFLSTNGVVNGVLNFGLNAINVRTHKGWGMINGITVASGYAIPYNAHTLLRAFSQGTVIDQIQSHCSGSRIEAERIVLSGWARGGGFAQLIYAALIKDNDPNEWAIPPLEVYTFGAPAVIQEPVTIRKSDVVINYIYKYDPIALTSSIARPDYNYTHIGECKSIQNGNTGVIEQCDLAPYYQNHTYHWSDRAKRFYNKITDGGIPDDLNFGGDAMKWMKTILIPHVLDHTTYYKGIKSKFNACKLIRHTFWPLISGRDSPPLVGSNDCV